MGVFGLEGNREGKMKPSGEEGSDAVEVSELRVRRRVAEGERGVRREQWWMCGGETCVKEATEEEKEKGRREGSEMLEGGKLGGAWRPHGLQREI
jgi:uncharacterized protein YcaQ